MSDLRAMLGDRYEALTAAISATVSDWLGHDTPFNPHDWRCEDYLGPCGHDGAMTDEVMAVLGDILPDLLAQAWDEGHAAGRTDPCKHSTGVGLPSCPTCSPKHGTRGTRPAALTRTSATANAAADLTRIDRSADR